MKIMSVGIGELFVGGQKVADVQVTAKLKGHQCGEGTVHLEMRNPSDAVKFHAKRSANVYVPSALYDEITSRPDWPEIEKRMKEIYGESWELVCITGGKLYGDPVRRGDGESRETDHAGNDQNWVGDRRSYGR